MRALVLGAKSTIAQAIVAKLDNCDFILAARDSETLEPFAADLRLRRECQVDLLEFDALDFTALESLPQKAHDECGEFDLVVLAFGYLGDQATAERDAIEMATVLNANFTGAAIALSYLANYLEERGKSGGIIGIGSVAGDRGRQKNYVYGAAKGGLALLLQGLRNRLAATAVHVLTVKPGFVDTPMTQDMDDLPLLASPEKVASDIVRAYEKKKDIIYTPFFWRWIMLIIRLIPERLFKKMKL